MSDFRTNTSLHAVFERTVIVMDRLMFTCVVFALVACMTVAPASAAQQVSAQLTCAPTVYTGPSPAVITFSGRITATEAGRVQYKFIRSDNASAPVETLQFTGPGTKPVSTTWTLGGKYTGWQAIQIVYPQQVQSNKANFRVDCGANQQIHALLKAEPDKYVGPAPAVIKCKGTISVTQPCTVTYRFIRSDNATGPVKSLTFAKPGIQGVYTDWTLGGAALPSYSGWEAIKVLTPVEVESNKANFSIKIEQASSGGQTAQLKEDCVTFDPKKAEVKQINGRWKIVDGNHWVFDFDQKKDEALLALRIIKHYGMNSSCFVGRPDPSFTYLLVSGNAPAGAFKGEDAVSFNPKTAEVKKVGGMWKIVDGSHQMFAFGDKEAEARQALAIIQKYGFTKTCYVGRPDPSFTYLRK